jgi:hypothetical protein
MLLQAVKQQSTNKHTIGLANAAHQDGVDVAGLWEETVETLALNHKRISSISG